MARTFLWRLLAACATLLMLVGFAFLFLKAAPKGPYDAAPAVSAAVLPKISAGFDPAQPGYQQFGRYLGNALQLDFGPTFRYRDYSVADLLFRGAPITLQIVACAMLLALVLGLVSSCAAGWYRHSWFDRGLSAVASVWLVVPVFILAPLFQLVFGVHLQWLPIAGWDGGWLHMLLPVLTLALPLAVVVDRLARDGQADAAASDLKQRLGIALDAVSARLGALVSAAFALSIPLERAFSLPGAGRYVAEAGRIQDYPLLAGAVLFYGGIIILVSLVGDLVRLALGRDEKETRPTSRSWAALRRDPVAGAGAGLFLAAAAACFVLPALLPGAAETMDYAAISTAPSLSSGHLLGTDELGQDVLLQLLQGGAGSIRLALLTAGLAGAILAVWRLAETGGGLLLRRWGGLLQGLLDALPFLLLAIVLRGWWPARVPSETAGVIGLVWLVLWLARHCRWPVARAICFAIPASLVGEAYLANFGVTDFVPTTTLGGLLAAGLGGIDTAPWSVLAAMSGLILLAGSAALVAARMQAPSARG